MWIPCCLVWDGVELELELELAGLGCSDLKEEKVIINKCTGHYTSKIKTTIVAQTYFTPQKQSDTV